MPASDQSALAILQNFSSPYIQKRYRKDNVTEAALFKLCRAISTGFHAETGQAIDDLEPQRFDKTASGGFLSKRAVFWNVPRQTSETDGALRLRIGQVKLVKWGAFNVDDMLNLLSNLLQTDVGNIGWNENVDESGNWEPGLITFNIDPNVFVANGVADVAAAVTALNAEMEKVAPAGVRVIVTTLGTAMWDSTSEWDDGTSSWSR